MPRRLAAALLLALAAAPAAAHPAHGLWRTEAREDGAYLVVELLPCEGAPAETCGVIRRASNPALGETEDAAEYAHIGRTMIEGMTPDGDRFEGGTIWAPDDDETYRASMKLKGPVLEVEGCVLIICRGQDWTRVE